MMADLKSIPQHAVHMEASLRAPLYEAAKNGYTDIVKFLYDQGAVISEHASNVATSAVTAAAKNGHNDTVMYLLAHESDDESRDLGIRFAMGEAISTDNLELLQMIHTAYPNKKYRMVMLIWAARFNKNMIPYIHAMYSE
jgi:ankyrin repeat protein